MPQATTCRFLLLLFFCILLATLLDDVRVSVALSTISDQSEAGREHELFRGSCDDVELDRLQIGIVVNDRKYHIAVISWRPLFPYLCNLRNWLLFNDHDVKIKVFMLTPAQFYQQFLANVD